eukprot:1151312-Pelagomonas_calceolata.AAC.1
MRLLEIAVLPMHYIYKSSNQESGVPRFLCQASKLHWFLGEWSHAACASRLPHSSPCPQLYPSSSSSSIQLDTLFHGSKAGASPWSCMEYHKWHLMSFMPASPSSLEAHGQILGLYFHADIIDVWPLGGR